jgi:predicted TIM-barrel fold metal-dependent hydrolase
VPLEPYIDAHSHVWTPNVVRYPLAEGFAVADMNPPSFTADELLAHCRPAGVGRVNLIQMSFYKFDNSYMLDMIRLHPERFVGTGIVDPLGSDPGKAMRALLPRGVRAFRIQPKYSQLPASRWLEPAGYDAMFATAAQTGQALSCLIDPDGFPEVDRMCRKHPGTTVIIDHLGRVGVDGTIRDADVAALCVLAKHPKVLVKVGAFYALGRKSVRPTLKPDRLYLDLAPLIRRVVEAFGPERCMWESDSPFQIVEHKYIDSLTLIRERLTFLSLADRDWLLWRTAERTLFRPL